MDTEKIMPKLKEALRTGDRKKLFAVAHALGNELPRNRLDLLSKFRYEIAREGLAQEPITFEFVVEVLFAYCTVLQEKERFETAMEWLRHRHMCQHILKKLQNKPQSFEELVPENLRNSLSFLSAFNKMLFGNMIDCHGTNNVTFSITPFGKKVLDATIH